MNTRQLPSGTWQVTVYIGKDANGKRKRRTFTAPTKKEAERLAASYEIEQDEVRETIQEAIENYITNRSSTLSPSTIRAYRTMQRNDFEPINRFKVNDITSEDIQIFVNDLARTKSPKSVRNIYALLKASILAFKPNKAINVRLPQKNVIERQIPTAEDIKRILDNADSELTIAILLASYGTLRIGEICALDYEDISGNTIHIHKDMIPDENNKWVIKKIPKTNSSDRYVSYPQEVIDQIGKGKGRITSSTPRAISLRYAKICKRLGIPSTRFHDLRHYAASQMHAMGIPDQYIMSRGGWSTDTVLKSVYRNTLSDEQKRFEDMINEKMSEKLN